MRDRTTIINNLYFKYLHILRNKTYLYLGRSSIICIRRILKFLPSIFYQIHNHTYDFTSVKAKQKSGLACRNTVMQREVFYKTELRFNLFLKFIQLKYFRTNFHFTGSKIKNFCCKPGYITWRIFNSADIRNSLNNIHSFNSVFIQDFKQQCSKAGNGAVSIPNVMSKFRNRVAKINQASLFLFCNLQVCHCFLQLLFWVFKFFNILSKFFLHGLEPCP